MQIASSQTCLADGLRQPTRLNVWLGASVEMKKYFGRMDILRKIPAVVRFAMCEPLLEDLTPEIAEHLEGFHWLMVGGESGNGTDDYRPMDLQWARNLRDLCAAKAIPFYFKQPAGRWTQSKQRPKAKLDGVVHDAYPAALKTYKPAFSPIGLPGKGARKRFDVPGQVSLLGDLGELL